MAFKATAEVASEAFTHLRVRMAGVKSRASNRSAAMAAGNVGSDLILALRQNLVNDKAFLQSKSSVNGIVQYAKDQYDDQTYDVTAEYTAAVAALDAVIANIDATFPWSTFQTDFDTYQQFTPAQTATLRGLLDTLDAAIE